MKKGLLPAMILLAILIAGNVLAATVTATWDKVPDAAVTGYKLHYGTTSKAYTVHLDAQDANVMTVANLQAGQTYYFAATAYSNDKESAYSNEVAYTVPIPAPGNLKIVVTVTP
jgi:fibronectin type 3 domain-containing protein